MKLPNWLIQAQDITVIPNWLNRKPRTVEEKRKAAIRFALQQMPPEDLAVVKRACENIKKSGREVMQRKCRTPILWLRH